MLKDEQFIQVYIREVVRILGMKGDNLMVSDLRSMFASDYGGNQRMERYRRDGLSHCIPGVPLAHCDCTELNRTGTELTHFHCNERTRHLASL